MKVALGMKAHTGWAAVVALTARGEDLRMVERGRLAMIEASGAEWAKQPYHAAEGLAPARARELVRGAVAMARRLAKREVRRAAARLRAAGHEVVAGAVLTAEPIPDWSVDDIIAVHVRMHQAEGVLFRDALVRAVRAARLRCVEITERRLDEAARQALGAGASRARTRIAALRAEVGPPWGKDQKDSALAALIALRGGGR